MKKINVGCGMDYRAGWLNVDISPDSKADEIIDIGCDVLPVENGEAELVYCSGVLEQILTNNELIHAMNEMWRVLRKGGMLEIVVPNAEHSIAFQDPHDCRKFTPKTFAYFIEGEREYQLYGKVYGFRPWSNCNIQENQRNILEVKLVK